MIRTRRPSCAAGFTLIELLMTVALVGLIATLVFPLAEMTVKRNKERELKSALMQIRMAIDAYKQAVTEGHIEVDVMKSGYPPNLQVLADGVVDIKSPNKDQKLYFLRRLPKDPMSDDPTLTPEQSWGKRSYASPPDAPQEGDDVFDVHTLSLGTGMNGVLYSQW